MRKNKTTVCPYKGCKLGCVDQSNHRSVYAHINKSWRKKVEKLDEEIKHKSPKVNWEILKDLGILYTLPRKSGIVAPINTELIPTELIPTESPINIQIINLNTQI
jgi:hypothetical protein